MQSSKMVPSESLPSIRRRIFADGLAATLGQVILPVVEAVG
jgi:hypothetical protein